MNIDAALETIREIPPGRNYWFLRTYGGSLYQHFLENSYISIGINDIPIRYLNEIKPGPDRKKGNLINFLTTTHNLKQSNATRFLNQITSFVYKMKVGDIVMIPTHNSARYAIGEITQDLYSVIKTTDTFHFDGVNVPYPEKRKSVRWIKTISSSEFKSDIGRSFFSRSTLTNVSHLGDFIEGYLNSFYVRNQQAYLMISINQDEDINAFHFRNFLDGLTYFYKEFCESHGHELNEDLYLKIKVQSKGKTLLRAAEIAGILGLAGLFILSNSGEFEFEGFGTKLKGKSDGLLQSWSEFLDAKQERQIRYEEWKKASEELKANTKGAESEKQLYDEAEEEGEQQDNEENG